MTSQPSPDVAGILERRPLSASSAVTSSEPAWQVIDDAFARWGFTAPPTRMRDELVNHLQWARFGFEAARALTSLSAENKALRERPPCEPTGEMIEAGLRAWFAPDGPFFPALGSQQREYMAQAYRAMVAAKPASPN